MHKNKKLIALALAGILIFIMIGGISVFALSNKAPKAKATVTTSKDKEEVKSKEADTDSIQEGNQSEADDLTEKKESKSKEADTDNIQHEFEGEEQGENGSK